MARIGSAGITSGLAGMFNCQRTRR